MPADATPASAHGVAPLAASLAPPVAAANADANATLPPERVEVQAAPVVDGFSIHGNVVDDQGKPLADAAVRLYSVLPADLQGVAPPMPVALLRAFEEPGTSAAPPLAEAITNADGVFRITVAPHWPTPVSGIASATGHTSHARAKLTPAAAVTFRLSRIVQVQGRVLAADTGLALPGAVVDGVDGVDGQAVADAKGRYVVFAAPTRGRLSLTASHAGYVAQDHTVVASSAGATEHDFVLSRGVALRVQVVGADDGQAIAGAEVRRGDDVLAHSDPTGHFVVTVADGMALELRVAAEGRGTTIWSWHVRDAATTQPRIPLAPIGTITGLVTTVAGEPIADAKVSALRAGIRGDGLAASAAAVGTPGSLRVASDATTTSTGEDGRFVLRVAATGIPQVVAAQHRDHAAGRSAPVVVDRAGANVHVVLQLQRGATIRGKARHNGKPWHGQVSWDLVGSSAVGGITALTDDADFVLSGIPPGEVELVLRAIPHGAGNRARLRVEAGADIRHDFVWDDVVLPITGRVTSSSGQPLDGIAMHGRPVRDQAVPVHCQARTDAEGRYTLACPQPGEWIVTASRDTVRRQREGVAAGSTDVDFVLPELGRLQLHLVDATTKQPIRVGERAFGGDNSLAWRENESQPFIVLRDRIDGDGRVDVRLPIGNVDLSLWLHEAGYSPRTLVGVAVTDARDAPPIVVELTRGSDIEFELDAATPLSAEIAAQYLLFCVDDRTSPLLRGPVAEKSPECNFSIDGIGMWIGEPGAYTRLVQFHRGPNPKVRGLAPGRHRLRAFPDDLVFEPAEFDVPAAGAKVVVRWRRR